MKKIYTHNHSVAILIPMHNEAKGTKRCVNLVMAQMKHVHYHWIVIVIDDGSTDSTSHILKTMKKTHSNTKLHIVRHTQNMGYGSAIKTGIHTAYSIGFEYALCIDSDLTNNPIYIHDFLKKIPYGYDCVKASRYIASSKIINVPFMRKAVSRIGNAIASRLFHMGITDCTNGFRMLKLRSVKDIPYNEHGFASIMEELYFLKAHHALCQEIPTVLTSRIDTKTHFRYTIQTFWNYLKYALYAYTIH